MKNNNLEQKYKELEKSFVTYKDLCSVTECDENADKEAFSTLPASGRDVIGRYRFTRDMEHASPNIIVRETVYKKLRAADAALKKENPDWQLAVMYGYRSLDIQEKLFNQIKKELKPLYGNNESELTEAVHRKIAVPEVSGHPTGGAVHVLIYDFVKKAYLDFGVQDGDRETLNDSSRNDSSRNDNSPNDNSAEARKAYYDSPEIAPDSAAKKNRKLLRDVMTAQGFAPYDGDFSHFSYGDKEWAFYSATPHSALHTPHSKTPNKIALFFKQKVHPFLRAAWQKHPFLILTGAALILRILCVFLFSGYRPDLSENVGAIGKLMKDGVKYYSANSAGGAKYAPGQLYIFGYIGLFTKWFGLTEGGAGMIFFMKLPSLLADLGIGWLLFLFTKRFSGKKTALCISALYLFNPAVLFAFVVWGGSASVFIFFLMLALRYMLDRKYLEMCAVYAAAVLFSASALTAAPLLLVLLVTVFVRAASAYSRRSQAERKNPDGVINMPKYSALWKAPVGILIFFVSLLLLCLPFTAKGITSTGKYALFNYCSLYKDLCMNFTLYTNNAFNIAGLMNKNGLAYASPPSGLMTAMYFVMCAILAAVYLTRRNRANFVLLTSLLYFILAFFMANADPLSAVPGLILLLFACAVIGDRRLFGQYLILSMICLFNISAVMIAGKYMNSLPEYLFNNAANPAYTVKVFTDAFFKDMAVKPPALGRGLMIAGSVLALVSFLYYMYVAMDIAVANKRKVFMPFDRENPYYALDTFISLFR